MKTQRVWIDLFVFCVLSISDPLLGQSKKFSREPLLSFRNESGVLEAIEKMDDWKRRRASILQGMQTIMGPLPQSRKRIPLKVELLEEIDCGSYVRQLITYTSERDCSVPAYVLIPKKAIATKTRRPAVLCLHPTDNVDGHKLVVGLGKRPNRQYAQELAERGFVTIAPAYPLLANYQPNWRELGYESGTMKAIWDNMRALDYLESLEFVDAAAFGAIGHSLGGHNSVYTAVFDKRIKVVVSSCGLDSFLDYKNGDIRGWTSDRYMPRLLEYQNRLEDIPFDFHELIAALAPRSCLILAPKRDSNFKWRSVMRIQQSASTVYNFMQVPNHLKVRHPDCAHDFPPEMRKAAYTFIERVLPFDSIEEKRGN